MGRSRAARQKDKLRKRQERMQIVEAFTYHPVHDQWRGHMLSQLQISNLQPIAVMNPSTSSVPLTRPETFRTIIGDGNCFFRCISFIISGSEENHNLIRQQICAYMRTNPGNVTSFLPSSAKNVFNYLQTTHMGEDNTWATEVEIYAATMLLKTNIYVYSKHGVHWTWTRYTTQYTTFEQSIYLFHKNENHFEVVVGIENSEFCDNILNDNRYYSMKQHQKESSSKKLLEKNKDHRDRYSSDNNYRKQCKIKSKSKYKADANFCHMIKTQSKLKYKSNLVFRRRKQNSAKIRQKFQYKNDPLYAREKKMKSQNHYLASENYRMHKKLSSRLKYCTNMKFRKNLLLLSKKKYASDAEFKTKSKLKSSQRYKQDQKHREYVKSESYRKYAENGKHRQTVKQYSTKKYAENAKHRQSVKNYSTKKYAENAKHRQSVKNYSTKKYAENAKHRQSVKNYSTKKYAENAVHRDKVKKYSKMKYERFASFRNYVKTSSIKKYASSPLFRSCIKHHLKNQYHTYKTVRDKKKTRVVIARKSIIKAIHKFKEAVADTPEYICTVCIRILYKNQVKICDRKKYYVDGELNKTAKECLTGLYLHICDKNCNEDCSMKEFSRDKEWICHNCDRYLKTDSMPPQSIKNNLSLPEIPESLGKLNVLERQLIALRIPFMKLLSLPRGGQKGVKGPIVSVPTDLNTVTASLPRDFNESQLIKVKLKRKLEYKGHYTYKWINPTNVLEALDNLLHNNCWYDHINLDKSWIENISESGLTEPSMEVDDSDSDEEASQQTEAPTTIPVDSCFQPIDLGQEMLDTNNTLCLAPSEHQKPQNIFQEDGADAMAFPNLLPDGRNGLFESRKIKLSPAKYFNARLFSADTRFATDKEFIFFAQYVTEINYITSNISLALRKGNPTTNDGKKVTASMILDSDKDNVILKSDIGYRFLQPVRGTPPYWQRTMKDLYAIIRQLGIPTWFVTFSAAEMRWKEVTKTLLHLNNDTRPVDDIEWSERATLVTNNPVMCARMFDHRVKALFTDLIMSPSCPVGKVTDYFYRTEFQQRGSPHIHCLLWVQDSPKLNEDSDEEVCRFINKYVTCRMPEEDADPELYEIISSVQLHSKNHSKSCKKYSSVCRFNFPRPPVQKTFIARADSDTKDQDMSTLTNPTVEELDEMSKQSARTPKQILRDMWILLSTADDSKLTFPEILTLADVTYSQFKQCLTDVATRNTVYLQRQLSDIWVNNYNPHLSRAWNANLDIQFVTDAYACVAYILSYISKAEAEMGDLLQNAKEEADEGNIDASAAMKKIANVYLQNREVSSQEAVYRVCGLHLKECTRDVVFVPAGKNIQRMSLPISVIKARTSHGGDEDNIWMSSIYDKYFARPDTSNFHNMSLAEFCSKYRILSKSQYPKSTKSPKLLPVFELQKGLGYIQQRKPGKEAVIRFPRFNIDRNPDDYYLALIQLYLPHRTTFILPSQIKDYEEFVRTGQMNDKMIHHIIDENRHHFEKNVTDLEKAWQDMQDGKIQEGAWAYIAPEAEIERLETITEKEPEFEDEVEAIPELNYNQDQNTKPKIHTLEYQAPKIPAKDIKDALRNMNTTQQQVFYKIRDWCLQFQNKQPEPFHMFLTGGAGTGKSHLVKCIYSEATRILSKFCTSPDSTTVLLTAPTGTAAFNIQGLTIHSAFAINKNIKLPYQPLGENILNTLRNKFEGLKILIVDEISMVDQKILCYIHGRLAQIKHSKSPFGGISIIAVGDFYQLPPVKGLPLYKNKESFFFDLWNTLFSKVTLTEVMRQKNDQFATMLNRLRTHIRGHPLLSEDLKALSDMSYNETPMHAKTFLHIFPTNKEVDRHNEEMINRTCQPVFSSMAKDYFRNITTGEIKQREPPYSSTTSEDLQMVVKIGVRARVMLTRNLDTDDGLVNGAFGTITSIDNNTTTNITAVYVKFDNAKIGLKCQKKTVVDRAKKGSVRIQPIEETLRGKQVTRKQFPFKLGWAATIHKVQGMTVPNIVISMKKIFQSGMAYVALSRATSTTGLYIINFDPNTIYSSEDITEALQKMPSFLQFSNNEITTNTTDGLQFIHHNTEGILPHVADIKCNTSIQESDIICFTETWMKANTKIPKSLLPKHTCHQLLRRDAYEAQRNDFKSLAEKDRGGVSIFVRSDILHSRLHFTTHNIEAVACVLQEPISMMVLSIYRPPSYPVTLFKQTLTELLTEIQSQSMPTLVFGDFNENSLKIENSQILQTFNSFGYRQLVDKPTTESLTCLDLVFVNELSDETSAIVVPTYYSFHDAVNVFVPFKK